MYKAMMIVATAAMVSSGAWAQMSTNPSTGTTLGTGGSNQTMGTREQECRAITNEATRKTCLDNLNVSGPASGNNSQSTGSSPGSTTGSGSAPTGSGSMGSGTGSNTGTTR